MYIDILLYDYIIAERFLLGIFLFSVSHPSHPPLLYIRIRERSCACVYMRGTRTLQLYTSFIDSARVVQSVARGLSVARSF